MGDRQLAMSGGLGHPLSQCQLVRIIHQRADGVPRSEAAPACMDLEALVARSQGVRAVNMRYRGRWAKPGAARACGAR